MGNFSGFRHGFPLIEMKTKRILNSIISVLLIISLTINFPFSVKAEEEGLTEGQSTIINGSFEEPDLITANPSVNWINTDNDNVPGWETTSTDKKIEFGWILNGASAHMTKSSKIEIVGNGASDGYQFAEVVANEPSSIYQSLSLSAGKNYSWTIHHRGRSGVDTLALVITDDTKIDYIKSSTTGTDHFQQIIAWMKNNGVTSPQAGEMVTYTVYTTELKDANAFEDSSTGSAFSFDKDEEHTVKFEICLMSTDKADWGEYAGTYRSEIKKDILFVLTPFSSSHAKASSAGNLIDNLSFSDSDGNNLLVNAGFDDVTGSASYQYLNAANAASPTKGIGWCTTASDYKVEIGNISKGDPYGLGATIVYVAAPYIRDGEQYVELNANEESSLYQVVNTEAGKMYKWSLSHRGRDGVDTMALIIGPNQDYAPAKVSKNSRDQLMQIVDWLTSQTEMPLDIPDQGCSQEIKVYTSKFNSNGGWELSEDLFSWRRDEDHTEEWSVWIISSSNDAWYDYGELEEGATYNYDYIVPEGQEKAIFGFVSYNSTTASGTKNLTYGNLLDNISFKEYYYIKINNTANSEGGYAYITNDDGSFLFDSGVNTSGWALYGKDITVHIKEGTRKFIGAYINDVFVPKDQWEYDEESGEYYYKINITSSKRVDLIYVAETVVYDSRSNYVYQYDGENTGYEIPMGPEFTEYTSHAPEADDGWKFVAWKYHSTAENKIYSFDAVHKIQYEANEETSLPSFSIYRFLEDGSTELVVSDIPESEGVTFIAEWKYRQRVVSKTYNTDLGIYETSSHGGTTEINVLLGNNEEKTDYYYDSLVVGEELYASSESTFIKVSAFSKTGYTFDGWYDEAGNLVSKNSNYTYNVKDSTTVELYAYFVPVGYNLVIDCTVVGDSDDSAKYFAIDCSFSNLRENSIYAISGLNSDTITINGEQVTNPGIVRADAAGEATVTIYMKHGDSIYFVDLPELCIFSVDSDDDRNAGYSVRGEVNSELLSDSVEKELVYYKAEQSIRIEEGKHYEGITSDEDPEFISITQNSSYTIDVETRYTPKIYTDVEVSLCYYDLSGSTAAFAAGTRILMLDLTDENHPKYYVYVVPESGDPVKSILLEESFTELGTSNSYKIYDGVENYICERLVFLVDYVDTGNSAESGKIALVYNDADNGLDKVINPVKKEVNIGEDTTKLTATAGVEGSVANAGPFPINITINESTPYINTTYKDIDFENSLYDIRLTVAGGLPDGSYAEIDGERYYSNKGYINISSLSADAFSLNVYSPLPLEIADGKVTFTVTMRDTVSTSAEIPADQVIPVVFNCVDVQEYAIDADVPVKVLTSGHVSQADITLKYLAINDVKLTINRKNSDGTFSSLLSDVNITLPAEGNSVTVDLGSGYDAVSGETYIYTFVGYADGVPVCVDKCCIVGGYE
ncbi:MAG: hypothetical protein ACI39R_00090 [Lachnospiraceae bacterium]